MKKFFENYGFIILSVIIISILISLFIPISDKVDADINDLTDSYVNNVNSKISNKLGLINEGNGEYSTPFVEAVSIYNEQSNINMFNSIIKNIKSKVYYCSDSYLKIEYKILFNEEIDKNNFYIKVDDCEYHLNELIKDSNNHYHLDIALISAKEMTDFYWLEFYLNNNQVGETIYVTFRNCMIDIINSEIVSDNLKKFAYATLNYGAYNQLYFKYNINELANENYEIDITEFTLDENNDPVEINNSNNEIIKYGTSLTINGNIKNGIYLIFKDNNHKDYDVYINGKLISGKYKGIKDNKDIIYYSDDKAVSPPNFNNKIIYSVKKDNQEIYRLEYSVLSYCNEMINQYIDIEGKESLIDLVNSIYSYYYAAIIA